MTNIPPPSHHTITLNMVFLSASLKSAVKSSLTAVDSRFKKYIQLTPYPTAPHHTPTPNVVFLASLKSAAKSSLTTTDSRFNLKSFLKTDIPPPLNPLPTPPPPSIWCFLLVLSQLWSHLWPTLAQDFIIIFQRQIYLLHPTPSPPHPHPHPRYGVSY